MNNFQNHLLKITKNFYKTQTIIDFFKSYDKQRVGYFSKDILSKILDDLEVDTMDIDEISV